MTIKWSQNGNNHQLQLYCCWILYPYLTYYNMNVFPFENDDRQDKNLIDQYT